MSLGWRGRLAGEVAGAAGRHRLADRRLPLEQARRVLEVELAQDLLGQAEAVDLPAALDRRGRFELAVVGLEVAPGRLEEAALVVERGRRGAVRAVHHVVLRRPHAEVGAEQDAVLVLLEELPHLARVVPADLGHARRGVDVEVGVLVEHAGDVVGILGVVAEVHADEDGLGVAGHASLELRVELVPTTAPARRRTTSRVGAQLVHALVLLVGRLPERLGIAGVDRHRHAQLARLLEQRIQLGIVDGQAGARRRAPG